MASGKREPEALNVIDSIRTVADDLPSVVSRLKTAAEAAPTLLPDIIQDLPDDVEDLGDFLKDIPDLLEKMLPKNSSVGTSKFCVGFADNLTCHDLPLSLSDLLPSDLVPRLGRTLADVTGLDAGFAKITGPHIRHSLIAGIMTTLLGALISVASFYGWPFKCRVFVSRVVTAAVYVVFELLL